MPKSESHSPLPWFCDNDVSILASDNTFVAAGLNCQDRDLILRAVNNHERLIQALSEVARGYEECGENGMFDWIEWYSRASDALAAAKGDK